MVVKVLVEVDETIWVIVEVLVTDEIVVEVKVVLVVVVKGVSMQEQAVLMTALASRRRRVRSALHDAEIDDAGLDDVEVGDAEVDDAECDDVEHVDVDFDDTARFAATTAAGEQADCAGAVEVEVE